MSEKFAEIISYLLHPLLFGLALIIYLAFFKGQLAFYQLIFLFFLDFFIPVFFIFLLLKKKVIKNFDISDVTKRKYFYFPVFVFALITSPFFIFLKIPSELTLMQVGFLIWIFCWAVISLFYKISGHVGGASFVYTSIIYLLGSQFWWLFLLLPILAWSRVKLKQHTWDQTIVGGVLGFLISYIVFTILDKL